MPYIQSRWRRAAEPIIKRVILENTAAGDEKALAKALREAYPFGPREHYPYKVWCDEINKQLGKGYRYFRKNQSFKPPYEGKLIFGQRPEGY
jgi:hypothetical protein